MTVMIKVDLLLAGSYLLGSLPFGLWIALRWKGVDIRTVGSGNIGATNVGRVCGPVVGAAVFVLDVLKGLLPPMIGAAMHLRPGWQILAALFATIGHNYSVWLGFKGGKGIATSLGALFGIAPIVGIIALTIFSISVLTLRWISVGSILGATSLPFTMLIFYPVSIPGNEFRFMFGMAACVMALYKHWGNVERLRKGTEPRVHLPWTRDLPAKAKE